MNQNTHTSMRCAPRYFPPILGFPKKRRNVQTGNSLSYNVKLAIKFIFFGYLEETCMHKKPTSNRKIEQKQLAYSIFACINRCNQLNLISYPLLFLLRQNLHQLPLFPFLTP